MNTSSPTVSLLAAAAEGGGVSLHRLAWLGHNHLHTVLGMFPSGKKQVTKAITVHAHNTRPCGWLWLQSHKHAPPAQRSFQNLSCHWHLSMCWIASQPCWSFKSAHHNTCCKLRCTCRWVAPVWVVGEPPPATLLPACMPHPLLLCFNCRRHHTPLCRPNRKLHSQAANGDHTAHC